MADMAVGFISAIAGDELLNFKLLLHVTLRAFRIKCDADPFDRLDSRLVRREAGLVQLFDPPFDKSALDPGYIKGYIPGVRENGGQYTHGGIWVAMAFALMGDHERAWELFALLNPVNHGSTPEQIAT
ncbi:MAG: hypothetical protein Q8O64_09420, partial [Sideroxyarcus sp.]|nr:hypothetical protein [Sideroxyarcus sp.]